MSPVSSPLVWNTHAGNSATNTSNPNGTSIACVPVRRASARAPTTASPSPATDKPRPSPTASHSSRIGVMMSAIDRMATHSGLVKASTRSPELKTGPLPLVIWRTTRR